MVNVPVFHWLYKTIFLLITYFEKTILWITFLNKLSSNNNKSVASSDFKLIKNKFQEKMFCEIFHVKLIENMIALTKVLLLERLESKLLFFTIFLKTFFERGSERRMKFHQKMWYNHFILIRTFKLSLNQFI